MLVAEAGHEEVRVIVAFLVPQGEALRQAGLLDGGLEVLGQQLLGWIGTFISDDQGDGPSPRYISSGFFGSGRLRI
ncbi:hypothetical protein OPQ81_000118 [Rhizoctonia solani]|nr:hypothetical protein OPQ81_000118 [Rhizoctonia solani]